MERINGLSHFAKTCIYSFSHRDPKSFKIGNQWFWGTPGQHEWASRRHLAPSAEHMEYAVVARHGSAFFTLLVHSKCCVACCSTKSMNQLHKQILKSCRNTLSPLLEAESQRTCPRCSLIYLDPFWIHFGSPGGIQWAPAHGCGRRHVWDLLHSSSSWFEGSAAPRRFAFPVAMLAGQIDHMLAVFASVEKWKSST